MAHPILHLSDLTATPSTHNPRANRLRRAVAALGLLALGAVVASWVGCSSNNSTGGAFCPGGFIRVVNGMQTCEGLCAPYTDGTKGCVNPGNVCVNNLCALQCTSELDCPTGQECVPATIDGASGAGGGSGSATNVCVLSSKAPIGKKCPNGNECNNLSVCPDGSNCDYTQCGGGTCSPDPIACSNADGGTCSIGTCGDGAGCNVDGDCGMGQTCESGKCSCGANSDCPSGVCINGLCEATPCTVQGCPMSACKPLACLSDGASDADAYCTMVDCHESSDCGVGYGCDVARDPHPICGAPASKLPGLCGVSCASNVGCTNAYGTGATCTNGYCQAACVTPMMGDGTTYTQGPFCTQRNECRINRACDPCTTDLDCSAIPGQHCTAMPMGTDKFCTADCKSDADCGDGFGCMSNACVPRAGTCKGTGDFCQPCHNDNDCGSGKYCTREESGFERICVTPIGTIQCTSDAQCPTSPSGMHGKCMDASVESSPGDGVYHTCWLPYVSATDRFECWPGNTSDGCFTNADCFSKSCVGADPVNMVNGACK